MVNAPNATRRPNSLFPALILFGTENPGTGSYKDPKTGRMLDDIKPLIEGTGWLTEQDKKNIFEDNARKVFTRFRD